VRRSASVVFMKVNDLMLYLVGTGEYDELMRASPLDSLPALIDYTNGAACTAAKAVSSTQDCLDACGIMNCAGVHLSCDLH